MAANPSAPKKSWDVWITEHKEMTIGGAVVAVIIVFALAWFLSSLFRPSITREEALKISGAAGTVEKANEKSDRAEGEASKLRIKVAELELKLQDQKVACGSPGPLNSSGVISASAPAGLSPKESFVITDKDLVFKGKAKFAGYASDGRAIVSCQVPQPQPKPKLPSKPHVQHERIVQVLPRVMVPAPMPSYSQEISRGGSQFGWRHPDAEAGRGPRECFFSERDISNSRDGVKYCTVGILIPTHPSESENHWASRARERWNTEFRRPHESPVLGVIHTGSTQTRMRDLPLR